jgi:hypothetical protein
MDRTYFCVWVVRRLEPDLLDAHLAEEDFHESNQVRKGQSTVRDNTFDLVELGQVRCIHGFVSEDAVNAEELGRPEAVVFWPFLAGNRPIVLEILPAAFSGQLVQHVCGARRRVCAEE